MELTGKLLRNPKKSVQFELCDVVGTYLDDDILYFYDGIGNVPVIYSSISEVNPADTVILNAKEYDAMKVIVDQLQANPIRFANDILEMELKNLYQDNVQTKTTPW